MSNQAEQVARDLRTWDELGMHRTGTPEAQATVQWLAAEIQQAGAVPEFDPLPFTRRVPGTCTVSDGTRSVTGLPLFDGGTTQGEGVRGHAGNLDSTAPVAVTFYGTTDQHPSTRALQQARVSGRHQAIVAIAIADQTRPGLAVLNAESFRKPFGCPVLQVPTTAQSWLLQAATANTTLRVRAELSLERTEINNLQTRIPGREPNLPPIVVMTPCSSWWTSTSERGGGITLWLQAIRHFARNPPRRSVLFTANTGHELGHLGLDHYLEQQPALIASAHCWIHLGANFAAANAPVRLQASQNAWLERGIQALQRAQIQPVHVTTVGQRPLGEARNIFDGQGQYLSLLGGNSWFHHPEDRWPEAIDLEKTLRLSRIMLQLMDELAND